jgi:hypothetical protein
MRACPRKCRASRALNPWRKNELRGVRRSPVSRRCKCLHCPLAEVAFKPSSVHVIPEAVKLNRPAVTLKFPAALIDFPAVALPLSPAIPGGAFFV